MTEPVEQPPAPPSGQVAQAGVVSHPSLQVVSNRRPPPERYPLAGCATIIGFCFLTIVFTVLRSLSLVTAFASVLPGLTAGAQRMVAGAQSTLPPDSIVALQSLRRDAHAMTCLGTFDWDHPDGLCRDKALNALRSVAFEGPGAYGRLTVGVDPAIDDALRDLQAMKRWAELAVFIEHAPGPSPPNIELALANVARLAAGLAASLDARLPPVGIGAASVNEMAKALGQAYGGDPAKEVRTVAEPTTTNMTPVPPAPEPMPTPPGPGFRAVVVEPDGPKAPPPSSVLKPFAAALRLLEECPKDSRSIGPCVAKARVELEEASKAIAEYRAGARPDDRAEAAKAFLRLCDPVYGKLTRAATTLAGASDLAALRGTQATAADDPFQGPMLVVAEAKAALERATEAAATAP